MTYVKPCPSMAAHDRHIWHEHDGVGGTPWECPGKDAAPEPLVTSPRWRVGRSVGRTIYLNDNLVGMMDDREMAGHVVESLNEVETVPATATAIAAEIPPRPPITAEMRMDALREEVKAAGETADFWHRTWVTASRECEDARAENVEIREKLAAAERERDEGNGLIGSQTAEEGWHAAATRALRAERDEWQERCVEARAGISRTAAQLAEAMRKLATHQAYVEAHIERNVAVIAEREEAISQIAVLRQEIEGWDREVHHLREQNDGLAAALNGAAEKQAELESKATDLRRQFEDALGQRDIWKERAEEAETKLARAERMADEALMGLSAQNTLMGQWKTRAEHAEAWVEDARMGINAALTMIDGGQTDAARERLRAIVPLMVWRAPNASRPE